MHAESNEPIHRYLEELDQRLCQCQEALWSVNTAIEAIGRRISEFYVPVTPSDEFDDENDIEDEED